MTQAQKRRLGRGLAALIGDDTSEESVVQDIRALRHVPIELLRPNPHNPRKHFAEDDLNTLAQSLRDKGLLQPLVVRPKADGTFEIVAGERRWRASQRAGLHDLPVLVRELDDKETLEIALIENIQRSDLNAIEEARAYRQLLEQYEYTQQQLADAIGKSRSHIANTMRLLNLPDATQKQIEDGSLTAGHARALIATETPEELADKIIKLNLTVRQAEDLARETTPTAKRKATPAEKDADTRALEKQLSEVMGLAVAIKHKDKLGGQVVISYKTLDQLDDVIKKLGGQIS
ncbi:MAG: ParB/RepB/Spo0J family partition protein [Alphaproteobacteria bacterium]|nr:ParB/RepB/Spo0J family partition protein [Alphaproteobacteria bacterium]